MSTNTITLADGRVFPQYGGKPLAWDLVAYNSLSEQAVGYPRMRAVIRAMIEHRPEQIARERRELVRDSFCRMFGQNAKRVLDVVEEELRAATNAR